MPRGVTPPASGSILPAEREENAAEAPFVARTVFSPLMTFFTFVGNQSTCRVDSRLSPLCPLVTAAPLRLDGELCRNCDVRYRRSSDVVFIFKASFKSTSVSCRLPLKTQAHLFGVNLKHDSHRAASGPVGNSGAQALPPRFESGDVGDPAVPVSVGGPEMPPPGGKCFGPCRPWDLFQ